MKNKGVKGLSSIVATLLVILLVLVAVGIVWGVVNNVIKKGTEQIILDKVTLDLTIKKVSINNDTSVTVNIQRKRGGGDFESLKFMGSISNLTIC